MTEEATCEPRQQAPIQRLVGASQIARALQLSTRQVERSLFNGGISPDFIYEISGKKHIALFRVETVQTIKALLAKRQE